MSCRQCEIAQRNPLSGLYSASCDSCKARTIANGTDLYDAKRAGEMTPRYRDALEKVFGDRWQKGHEMVKKWASNQKGMT